MNSDCESHFKMLGAGLALALVIGACASLAPKADYVPPPPGSTWVQLWHDTGSYGSGDSTHQIKRGERIWQGQKVNTFEQSRGTLVAQMDGTWLAIVSGDTPMMSWNPGVNFDYPLEVGKTWTKNASVTIHRSKKIIPFSYTGKVEAYEDVSVPAGNFKAFKVHHTDTLGNDQVLWFSPQLGIFVKQHMVRTSRHPAGPGTRDVEVTSQDILK